MVIRDSEVTFVGPYYFTCNASWVTIKKRGIEVFKREPKDSEWYDTKHRKIVDALRALEDAILDASM